MQRQRAVNSHCCLPLHVPAANTTDVRRNDLHVPNCKSDSMAEGCAAHHAGRTMCKRPMVTQSLNTWSQYADLTSVCGTASHAVALIMLQCTRRCCDVESTSLTLIKRHNNVLLPVGWRRCRHIYAIATTIVVLTVFALFVIIIQQLIII